MHPELTELKRDAPGRFKIKMVWSTLAGEARLLPLLVLLALIGCAPRPGPEVLAVVPVEPPATDTIAIDVVTNRIPDATSGGYTDLRSVDLKLERFTISIPPDHQPMQIEWPRDNPDPATSFAVTKREVLPLREVATAMVGASDSKRATGRRDVVIFVHGYNYSFQESLFRLAQLVTDGDLDEFPILFSWPSAASVVGYVADRDAIMYSRDDLVRLLTIVADRPDIGRITLFGHSMGAMLVTEALRQLRLTGQDSVIERLENVVLAAPDIDIDVFRSQIEVIGPLDPPMSLLVAPDDRALEVSARLAGSRNRIGTREVRDPQVQAMAAANGIQVIDISDVSSPDATKHSRFVGLVEVFPRLRDEGHSRLAHAGAFVLEPLTVILMPTRR